MRMSVPANPPRPTFDRSAGALVAPTHGRRNVPGNGPLRSPTMGMPVVLTATLRAVASDVGSGSCRCLRRYQGAVPFRVEGAPESGAAAKRRGVGAGETGPAVCIAKRGSGSANAMTCTRAMDGAKRGTQDAVLAVPRPSPPPGTKPVAMSKLSAARGFHPFDPPTPCASAMKFASSGSRGAGHRPSGADTSRDIQSSTMPPSRSIRIGRVMWSSPRISM